MLRKTLWTAAAAATLAVPCQAQTNTFSAGSTFSSPTLTGFLTDGSLMAGMVVSWDFVGGGTASAIWGSLGGGVWGVSSGGFVVAFSASTTFGGEWGVSNTTGDAGIAAVQFNGAPGRTIFDCAWNGSSCENTGSTLPEGTLGSANGWSLTDAGGSFAGTVSGFYTNRVVVGGGSPVGDLYEQLRIEFTGGLGDGLTYNFIADTDNSDFRFDPPVPVPTGVPEPATMTLMATGLAAMAAARRRKQQKS